MITHPSVTMIYERNHEMRREVAATRLGRSMRANRESKPPLAHALRWELARFGGRISKLLRLPG